MTPLIESQETITELCRRYEETLAGYRQGAQKEQEVQGPQAAAQHSGYAWVLEQTLPVLRHTLSYPTMTSDPDGERKRLLEESTRRLRRLLEEWQSQLHPTNKVYHQGTVLETFSPLAFSIYESAVDHQERTVMLETVLANLAEIKHCR